MLIRLFSEMWAIHLNKFYRVTIFILLLFSNALLVSSFNVDWQYPIIISATNQDGKATEPNYFGASVAFLKPEVGISWVIIGAPKSNSTHPSHYSIPEPGLIWQCSLGKLPAEICRPMIMDPQGNFQNEDEILQRKDHGMLGGAEGMDLSSKIFVSCASRTESWVGTNQTLSYMQGSWYMRPRSYLLQNTFPVPTPASVQLNPFTVPKKESQANYIDNRNSQEGFSVYFARSGNELVITAPGRQRSMGSVIQYVSRDGGTNFEQSFVHVQPQCPQSGLGCFQYFGYSVTSGYYFTDNPKSPNGAVNSGPPMQYAIGTPRANNMTGNVLIVQFPEKKDGKLEILQELKLQDGQIGWYFGASLLSLDVNGDGKDDLIVGAPRYSRDQSSRLKLTPLLSQVGMAPEGLTPVSRAEFDRFGGYGDEGAAFIYLSDGMKLIKNTMINGKNRAWSQFGTAITSLGDLNMDGFKDFAVSAPFEDNSGAVYIYHGNQGGNFKEAAQIIYAKHIDSGLRGFGFSLTGNEDIDNNGFNDIAIGSFNSSQTVILRSKPIINVQGIIKSTQTKLEMTIKAFLVTSCVSFSGDHAPNNVEFTIRLIADSNFQHSPRVHITFADEDKQQGNPTSVSIEYKQRVTRGMEICTDFNAIVRAPLETSGAAVVFKQEVSIQQAGSQQVKPRWMRIDPKSGTFSVSGEDFSKFCKECPLISKRPPSELSLPLAVPCGDDDICDAELQLDISFRNVPDKGFMVGSAPSVTMDIKMTNHKETAIAPGVLVTWWRLKLKRIPGDCSPVDQQGLPFNKVTYRCNLGKLLEEGKSAMVSLEFDMTSFVLSDELIWNVTAITVSHETRPESQSVLLPLLYQADPYISGSRYLEFFNPDTLQPYTVFKHVYEVNLDGPSPVGDILVVFQLPVNITTEEETVVHVRTVVEASGLMSCQATKGHFSHSDPSIELPEVIEDPDFDAVGIGGLLPKDKDVSRGLNTSFVENDRLLIHCDSPFVACMEVTCKSAVYYPGTTIIISFPIDISADMIRRLMKMHKVSAIQVESKGKLVLSHVVQNIQPKPHQPDETVAITIIEKEGYKRISKWVYMLAVVIGILVLACVIFCLYSCGCFEEKDARKKAADEMDGKEVEEMEPLQQPESKEENGEKEVKDEKEIDEEKLNERMLGGISPFSDVTDPPEFVPQEPTIPEESEGESDNNTHALTQYIYII